MVVLAPKVTPFRSVSRSEDVFVSSESPHVSDFRARSNLGSCVVADKLYITKLYSLLGWVYDGFISRWVGMVITDIAERQHMIFVKHPTVQIINHFESWRLAKIHQWHCYGMFAVALDSEEIG